MQRPLIERQIEFDAIMSSMSDNSAESGVVLTGAAGVGKTTLARHVTETLGQDIQWVAGTESARNIPLGAFAQFVGGGVTNDPLMFLSSAREALLAESRAGADRVIIGVDDAHLLDHLSATLLHQLALDGSARIIATVRTGETVPDAVVALWKDGHLRRIDLAPFTEDQCLDFVEITLAGPVEGLSADLMWKASGGNALFLRHLLDGAREAGALRQVRGVWQLRGRTAVTSALASILERRLDQLPDSVLQVLRMLTFCEPIDIDVLAKLVGADAVDEAEELNLILVSSDSLAGHGGGLTVRFTHPLFGEVVRSRMGRGATRRISGQLVTALRARPVTSALARMKLAELTLDSDQPSDPKLLGKAAQDAIVLADVTLGERFARAALDNGGGVRAAETLARVLLWQGRSEEVETLLAALDDDSLDEVDQVRCGLSRFANLMFGMGDAHRAELVLDDVRQKVRTPALKTIVLAVSSASAFCTNHLDDALGLAQQVWNTADALPPAIEWAAHGGGNALALMGRGREVSAIATQVHAIESKTDALLRFPCAHGEILALTMIGSIDEAGQRAARQLEFSTTGQYLAWGLASSLIGTVDIAAGNFGQAVPHLEQCLAALNPTGAGSWSFPARIALIHAYSALGRVGEGRRALADADARGGPFAACYLPQLEIARAWLAAAEGLTEQAVQCADHAARWARESSQLGVEAEALHAATRFGDRTAATRLTELAEQVDGILVPVYARHALAYAHRDGPGLDRAAEDYARIGAKLSSADASAQASTAHSAAGDRNASARSAATASATAAQCGGAITPALRLSAGPLPLTCREREIAGLVAAGLSNKQIAQRLTVSVRTVEGHLYRACTKVDAADRDDLADMLVQSQNPHD